MSVEKSIKFVYQSFQFFKFYTTPHVIWLQRIIFKIIYTSCSFAYSKSKNLSEIIILSKSLDESWYLQEAVLTSICTLQVFTIVSISKIIPLRKYRQCTAATAVLEIPGNIFQ